MSTGTTTDYASNYVYENNTPQFFNQPEGYVEPNGSGWNYVYQYKDHLGNIRLSYSDKNNNGVILVSTDPNTNELVEENNYYPFGLKHKGYNSVVNSSNLAQNYKYNQGTIGKSFQSKKGKFFKVERQFDLGLNLDMTKFRMYDYTLGRFTSIDPLADADPQESWTPYQYAYNSPIQYNDPYGDCPSCVGALVGALVDVAVQGAVIYFDDSKSLDDFSWKSVGVSAIAGATGVGLISKIGRVGKVGKILKASAEVSLDGTTSAATQYYQDGEVKATSVVSDVMGGQVAKHTVSKFMDAKFSNSKNGKHLQTKINEQKNVAKGKSSKYAKSEADIKGAENKYKVNEEASGAAATTSSSTGTSKFFEEFYKYVKDEKENNKQNKR